MSEDSHRLDLQIRWEEEGVRRDQSSDSVVVGEAPDQEALSEYTELEEEGSIEEGPDDFEWDADREQALLDALDETVEGTSPIVHRHIEQLLVGLKTESIETEQAGEILEEILAFLDDQIAWEQAKAPVEHADFMQSRADKLNALAAWQEAARALLEFLENGEAVQLKVAEYAAEQGRGFLEQSLDLLMACEPD